MKSFYECKTCNLYFGGPGVSLAEHNGHNVWLDGERVETPLERMIKEEAIARSKVMLYDKHVDELRKAIKKQGRNPKYHRETMARHRKEWPVLWKAIDRILEI